MSQFASVKFIPDSNIHILIREYLDDTHPGKIDLLVGAYHTEEGDTYVLPVVRKVEKEIANDDALDHEYPPAHGRECFSSEVAKLALGMIIISALNSFIYPYSHLLLYKHEITN